MKECLDEGRLQAYFDGELSPDSMERVGRHLAMCAICAPAVREVERESALVFSALEPEMSQAVPTAELRSRIATAIEAPRIIAASPSQSKIDLGSAFKSLGALFRFAPQRTAAFASVLAIVILGSIFVAIKFRNAPNSVVPPVVETAGTTPPAPKNLTASRSSNEEKPPAPIKKPVKGPTASARARTASVSGEDQIAGVKLIPGEQNYLKTIAALDVNLKERGRESMSPEMRSEYERNLKLVDYAIAASRSKAKRNPNDPQAAEFMFAAYQSKIDMMSNIAEQVQWARR